MKEKSYLNEAIVIGEISIARNPVAIGVMDVGFMMGSMGREVGECVTTLFEKAVKKNYLYYLYAVLEEREYKRD